MVILKIILVKNATTAATLVKVVLKKNVQPVHLNAIWKVEFVQLNVQLENGKIAKTTNVKLVINHAKNVKEKPLVNVLAVHQEHSFKSMLVSKNALTANGVTLKITLATPVTHLALHVMEQKPKTVNLVNLVHS